MNTCPGCEPDDNNTDHIHQYITVFGGTYTVYYIEGKCYMFAIEAAGYLERVVGFTRFEALEFLRTLPRRYN